MVFKIRTSKSTFKIFDSIGKSEQLQPFILAKLAIALSLKDTKPLLESDFHRDSNGLELNRQTITGEYDVLFKCLIELKEKRHLEDEEYCPKFLKAHLDRGAKLLESEHKYYGGNFLVKLLKCNNGI